MMTQKLERIFYLVEFFGAGMHYAYSTSKCHVSYAIKEIIQSGGMCQT